MSNELEKKSEELEQTLSSQMALLKEDSQDWVKIGGLVLAGGIVAYAFLHKSNKNKKRETNQALMVLEREGILTKDLKKKITSSDKGTFWPSLRERLLLVGLAYAKEKFLPNLFTSGEDATSSKKRK
jgi:hypothetical protein